MLRLAGRAITEAGARVLWTVAEGRSGRRWRASLELAGGMREAGGLSLLVELRPDGRLLKLEIVAPAGLLTLHPEADGGSLHGNVVTAAGVEHVARPWSGRHLLAVAGDPLTPVLGAAALRPPVGHGRAAVQAVLIGADLSIVERRWTVRGLGAGRWQLGGEDAPGDVAIDARGVPTALAAATEWPLELLDRPSG